jgi:oxygen-independent coproporphyrinogen-3 oxidase
MAKQDSSLYIHIPYCRHKCGYCAFAVSTRGQNDDIEHSQYIHAMEWELNKRLEKWHDQLKLRTLYIGGGTPSRLSVKNIQGLFNMIRKSTDAQSWEEITFEINPEDLVEKPELPLVLEDLGVQRISLGTQTTSPHGLKALERKTNPEQVLKSVQQIRSQFKGSLSLDLIMGWPGQQLQNLQQDDLPFLERVQPDHLSIYLLNVEPGTKLERDVRKQRIELLPDEDSAALWEALTEDMERRGYKHYEISNFCRPGHPSLHNTLTWREHPYLGIGCGAVSRYGIARWTNLVTPKLYMGKIAQERWPVAHGEALSPDIQWQETLLLNLRHREGLKLSKFESKLQKASIPHIPKSMHQSISTGIAEGDLQLKGETLTFTPNGWSRFDAWISDWMLMIEDSNSF